ncbi:alpha/beta hydrolase-fold protein [Aestuariibaculum sp. M13]|uniref:alpha/beta hydrolase-fold protein n=1 Tax=Aestuariibaculum sp. M13 TaxID=2967132 RepID=UPI002159E04B|nr:alpha/beta hydrolase-fold protein [Aestuariibaculum sp. M13]MCR8667690.1 alpha/beta hydrolase-fold protein [Aestuariibaculum sp. M13]
MKTLQILCLLISTVFTINAQNSNDIIIGKIDSINSSILSEERKLWVHVPANEGSNKKYPVVYLLDGDYNFHYVVGAIHQLSGTLNICPKMIVVGIPNTNRTRDLTPSKVEMDPPFTDSIMAANSGGGNKFISFIEKELIPYISSNYPADSYRMLIGHSFGGLAVINTLIEKPELFNTYLAIDPSLSWDNNLLLNKIKSTPLDEKYSNKKLFLAIANTMGKDMDTLTVQKDTTKMTAHIRANLSFHSILSKNPAKNLRYKGKYYEKEDHMSVPLVAEYDALRFFFETFQLNIELEDYFNPDSPILDKIKNHYKQLSKEFGSELKPDEEYIDVLGGLIRNRLRQFERAEQFFKYNIENYPESSNAYNSLGDLYLEIGDKAKAIENYEKSVSLNKNSPSKDKLKVLKSE